MAPPVGDPNPGDTPPGDPQRCLPTPFLSKTYSLVEDRSIDEIISWNDDGSGFIVWNPTEFARDLLPKYFKHNNFSSFVRQLNTYGFRKVVPDRWEFSNDSFRKGEKRLLCDIQRRKVTPHVMAAAAAAPPAPASASVAAAVTIAVAPPMAAAPVVVAPVFVPAAVSPSHSGEDPGISSTSSPVANQASFRDQSPSSGCSTELIDENDRLRRENMQLTRELSQMKIMCDNIYSLMTNYAVNRPENGSARPLDLLMGRNNDADNGATSNPMADGESCTRIFGFPVGAKRMRESEYRDGEREQDLQLRLGGTSVKSEPSERDNSSDDHEYMWPGMCNGTSRKM